MKFVLDTDVCSAHMRRPGGLSHRFLQHFGQLAVSSVTLAELYAGAYRHSSSQRLLGLISSLLQEVQVLDFNSDCAQRFGQVRGRLLQSGISVPTTDLMIATAALEYDLTLVTHNTADFAQIPDLRLDDWLR